MYQKCIGGDEVERPRRYSSSSSSSSSSVSGSEAKGSGFDPLISHTDSNSFLFWHSGEWGKYYDWLVCVMITEILLKKCRDITGE